jgi:CheY-like chemotaxis protein
VDVEGEAHADAEVRDLGTLGQAIRRLALAEQTRRAGTSDVHILVSRTGPPASDAQLGSDWIGLTFTTPDEPPNTTGGASRDAYWGELTRLSVLVRALGGRLVSPQSEGVEGPAVLYLPAVSAPAARGDAEIRANAVPRLRILLLEDNPETRWAVAEILTRMDYEVMESESPEDFQRQASSAGEPVHLIVGEPVLSLREGVSLLLEASARLGGVPILLMTGRRLDEEVQAWLKSMGVQWLRKPFSRDDLLRRVAQLLPPSPPTVGEGL